MYIRLLLRLICKGSNCGCIVSLKERSVAYQSHTPEPTFPIATSTKGSAIARTFETVVTNKSSHEYGVERTRFQERKNFRLLSGCERLHHQRWCRSRTRLGRFAGIVFRHGSG